MAARNFSSWMYHRGPLIAGGSAVAGSVRNHFYRPRPLKSRRLGFESLEDRRMLATITVTSLADNLTVDGQVTLRWSETGGPPPDGQGVGGFGSSIIQATLARQLGGALSTTWRPGGLDAQLRFRAAPAKSEPLVPPRA